MGPPKLLMQLNNVTIQPRLYDTLSIMSHFCATKLFSSKLPLLYNYGTQLRHFESLFCDMKEVVNAQILHLCYVHLEYIHFHLGTT